MAEAYRADGIAVCPDMTVDNDDFARLLVTDEDGQHSKVELGRDWRAHRPVTLDIGPVLHPDDAVAAKMTALFGRALPRDFIDVDLPDKPFALYGRVPEEVAGLRARFREWRDDLLA